MATEISAKPTLRQRGIHELREFLVLAVYFYVTLGAIILMKTAVLHAHDISFAPWGIAVVKAMVLAKFMAIGQAMKVGQRHLTRPLIWQTLHQTFAFLLLLVALTIIEEIVVGLIHLQSVAASLGELFGAKLEETLAGILIVLLVLIPYCAIRVLSDALGEGRLTRMFFVEREPVQPRLGPSPDPARGT
jgi:hypothetical protein